MRQRTFLILVAILVPVAFIAGWYASRGSGGTGGAGDRKLLYYVDPMNPSFRSPEPGTAPCGMPLEPVYAGGATPGGVGTTPPGAVTVRADRLQLIGVAREAVRSGTLRHTLRLVGTVAPDETRLFRVTAATAGRIREMGAATTGSLVNKGEILGSYYSGELLVPQQNFLRMFETYQNVQKGGTNPYDNFQGGGQLATYVRNVDVARQALLNLGMTAEQVEEVAATRQPAYLVQIRAPAAGIVTSRNVSLGQSFDARADLFTIADLSLVWVLADAFEGQEEHFKAGTRAIVMQPGAGRRFAAVVSGVPPRFEAATRTLKVRLDVVNPGLLLRPDMLVDVELPVEIGPGLFVPKGAVIDSGTRRIVFVEQGEGVFVPRTVRAGRRLGERVEIVGGLMEGETIVTAGNFLLDSESRMRAAGAAVAGMALDPICGMEVDETRARANGLVSEYGGTTWFFCAPVCKQEFDSDPKAAAAKAEGVKEVAAQERQPANGIGTKAFHMEDPVCGMDVDPDEASRAGLISTFQGAPFVFCSPECKQEFDKDPRGVLSRPAGERSMPPAVSAPHEDGQHGMPPSMQEKTPPPAPQPEQMPMRAPARGDDESHGAASAEPMRMQVDPVCGMRVDSLKARAKGLVSEYGGKTWFFCARVCKKAFDRDPQAVAAKAQGVKESAEQERRLPNAHESMASRMEDPVCGMEVDPVEAREQGLLSEHAGKTWFFCAPECKQAFDADPTVYPQVVR
ncbi:efflux RND transporter periplasmic adaptor subunit [Syntrophobacter fumaroxidans]|uniref:Efflux transporter, RND family, MFP subunit n=1 Tax=Syntrophobacter fumaroxidans (strain DSM 10017 / MPOB) TaxID=335543 RepID=A0LKH7_SYNFM|nr:efflux RND transporter periplasmic adaptor subunit [Syntrophobacter fumaroxidans]ABK17929.1 efflux transporter, RND family, MFP subunit [Syntrophobacter fumaroxidans MPOB]